MLFQQNLTKKEPKIVTLTWISSSSSAIQLAIPVFDSINCESRLEWIETWEKRHLRVETWERENPESTLERNELANCYLRLEDTEIRIDTWVSQSSIDYCLAACDAIQKSKRTRYDLGFEMIEIERGFFLVWKLSAITCYGKGNVAFASAGIIRPIKLIFFTMSNQFWTR